MSTPNPAATDWVPIWALANPAFSGDLVYKGAFAAGSYKDGDIVVSNGVTYICVRPTSATPVPWPAPVYDLSSYQAKSEKGQANGYVGLDGGRSINIPGWVALNQASVGTVAFASAVTGDTANRFYVTNDGKINWGVGNIATDTNLYRVGAGILQTDGIMQAGTRFDVIRAAGSGAFAARETAGEQHRILIDVDGKIQWSGGGAGALDTNLYRSSAGVLASDNALLIKAASSGLRVGSSGSDATQPGVLVSLYNDPFWRFQIRYDGMHQWGPGTGAIDVTLYRTAAKSLATDGFMRIGANYTSAGSQSALVLSVTTAPADPDFQINPPPVGTHVYGTIGHKLWVKCSDGVWRSVALT